MSLFERIKNKRYDLQEIRKIKKKFPEGDDGRTNFNKNNKNKKTGGFEDVTGEGIKKGDYPKTRKELEAKRKEYGINKDGVPSKEGIKRYAEKAKQLKSGSNVPVNVTQDDLDKAKERMVGGKKITDKSGKVIGTTTGRYGGKLGEPDKKLAKMTDAQRAANLAKVKAKIDAKNPVIQTPVGPLPKTSKNMKKFPKPTRVGQKGFVRIPIKTPPKKKTFKNFVSKGLSKAKKFYNKMPRKGKAAVIGGIAVGGALIGNEIRKALIPGRLTRKDFSPTKAITDTKGKKIRFKYDTYNPATKSTTSAPNQAGPTITKSQLGKFERGEYNVKDQFGKKIDLNKRIQQSAFTKQLKDASKGTGFFGRQTKKDQKFLQKYKKAAEYRGIKVK